MPDSPITAKFLNQEEKHVAVERLRMNQQGMGSGEWKWDHVKDAALDPKTYLWFTLIFLISYVPEMTASRYLYLVANSFPASPAVESRLSDLLSSKVSASTASQLSCSISPSARFR